MIKLGILATGFTAFLNMFTCDQHRRKECEWYIVPEKNYADKVDLEKGFVPVCARNFENNKQHCPLQIKEEIGKQTFGRRFRYVDMQIETEGKFPRQILSVEFCDGKAPMKVISD